MRERGFLTREKEAQINELAERLERKDKLERIKLYKKKLTPLIIDIIAKCYSAK